MQWITMGAHKSQTHSSIGPPKLQLLILGWPNLKSVRNFSKDFAKPRSEVLNRTSSDFWTIPLSACYDEQLNTPVMVYPQHPLLVSPQTVNDGHLIGHGHVLDGTQGISRILDAAQGNASEGESTSSALGSNSFLTKAHSRSKKMSTARNDDWNPFSFGIPQTSLSSSNS
jgi:hypothetical protein